LSNVGLVGEEQDSLPQVFDYVKLAVIHPSSQSDQDKPEWIESYRHLVLYYQWHQETNGTQNWPPSTVS
jgi:hypothetical protein